MNASANPYLSLNFRHLIALYQVVESGNIRLAAERVHLSQPAVSQAIQRVEALTGIRLFERGHSGSQPTEAGEIFVRRIGLALNYLSSFNRYSLRSGQKPEITRLLTDPQLRSLIAVVRSGSYTLAAARLGLAQPSVHRAVRDLQKLLNRELFIRKARGVEATEEARFLARQASLAYLEIRQGLDELDQLSGRQSGRLAIGCLPMARTDLVPESVTRFLSDFPDARVSILDGPYEEQLYALLHGDVDFILGALRPSPATEEVVQEPLFDDRLALVVRSGHPALSMKSVGELIRHIGQMDWIAPREGAPTRSIFQQLFSHFGVPEPEHLLECSSLVAIRGLLLLSNRVALLSKRQVRPEIASGQLAAIDLELPFCSRPIGLTLRKDWHPTRVQQAYIDRLRSIVDRQYH